jgi:hypothetical protein
MTLAETKRTSRRNVGSHVCQTHTPPSVPHARLFELHHGHDHISAAGARASPLAHLNQILQPNRIAVILQLFESLSSPNMSIQSICYVIFREN